MMSAQVPWGSVDSRPLPNMHTWVAGALLWKERSSQAVTLGEPAQPTGKWPWKSHGAHLRRSGATNRTQEVSHREADLVRPTASPPVWKGERATRETATRAARSPLLEACAPASGHPIPSPSVSGLSQWRPGRGWYPTQLQGRCPTMIDTIQPESDKDITRWLQCVTLHVSVASII